MDGVTRLPDGSAFGTMSLPLPKDHWLYQDGHWAYHTPPMTLRMGTDHHQHSAMCETIREAAIYAVRAATMNGKEMDFDPDALVQNMIVGLLGYHTPDGLGSEDWENPAPIPSVVRIIGGDIPSD